MVKKTEIHITIVTIVLVIVFRPVPVRAFDLQPSQSEIAASDALTLEERARGQCVDCTAPLATNNSLLESIQATDSLYMKCLKWDYQLGLIGHLLEAGRLGKYSSDPFQYEMAKSAIDGQTTLWKQKCESIIMGQSS
jgi:hypothetical protein